jgi:hypothetical protein
MELLMKRLWLSNTRGLNNRIDPIRAGYDPEKGLEWLAESYNVDYDYTGRISRRRGWGSTDITSACHSLAGFESGCLFISGGNLCRLGTDFSSTVLRSVTANARMSYVEVADKIFFMNGVERGFIRAGVAESWTLPAVIRGYETTRVYQAPPIGQIVSFYRGRVYIVVGDVIWYTEVYGPNLVDYHRNNIPLDSVCQMFHPVKEGIFVGTASQVLFFRGNGPGEFTIETAYPVPAIRGSDVEIETSVVGDRSMTGVGVIWTSSEGICLGLPGGMVHNLTQRNLKYEVGTKSASVLMGDRYICSMADTSLGPLTLMLNVERLAAGQYINYTFNSFAKFGKRYLGANSSGIFVLDEDDLDETDHINSWIKLPVTDFGFQGGKRIRFIEMSYETDASLKVTPIADEEAGNSIEFVPGSRSNKQEEQKVAVGRYLRGRDWSLVVENLDGADFSIDRISAELTGLRPA